MEDIQLTQQEKSIVEQLEALWQLPRDISSRSLKNITEMLLRLQEPYKTIGLQKVAENTVSMLNLHILSLLALFQQEAIRENISSQERTETLAQVCPAIFQMVDQLSKDLSLSSLDDLAVLSNIAISLQALSQTNSAQDAQSWLYELPATCYQQLSQEHLLLETPRITFTVHSEPTITTHQKWPPYSAPMETDREELNTHLTRHQKWPPYSAPVETAPEMLFISSEDVQFSDRPPIKRSTPSFASLNRKRKGSYLAYAAYICF